MPTRKRAPQPKKRAAKAGSSRKSTAAVKNGPVPPYGEAIRQAIARGDVQEMRNLAATSRKWLADVSSALERLEGSLKKAGA